MQAPCGRRDAGPCEEGHSDHVIPQGGATRPTALRKHGTLVPTVERGEPRPRAVGQPAPGDAARAALGLWFCRACARPGNSLPGPSPCLFLSLSLPLCSPFLFLSVFSSRGTISHYSSSLRVVSSTPHMPLVPAFLSPPPHALFSLCPWREGTLRRWSIPLHVQVLEPLATVLTTPHPHSPAQRLGQVPPILHPETLVIWRSATVARVTEVIGSGLWTCRLLPSLLCVLRTSRARRSFLCLVGPAG